MHAVWLAEELEIGEVIVPWSPGTFSAWGMLQTDMRHDVVESFYWPLAELEVATLPAPSIRSKRRGPRCSRRRGSEPTTATSPLGRHALRRPGVHGQRPARAAISLEEIDADFHDVTAHATGTPLREPG